MQREVREHFQRRAALLQTSNQSKSSFHSCLSARDRVVDLIAQAKTLASRVNRHHLLHRLLHILVLFVFFGWVVFFRFFSQQSYALPGSGNTAPAPSPLLLWREFNPSSPRASPSAMSTCTSSLHPLVGDWSGSCQQLLGLNILDQPVCASSPCTHPFAVTYTAAGVTRRHSAGMSSSASTCTSVVPLTAIGKEIIEVSSPLKYMKHNAAKSAWFHGDPYSVTGARVYFRAKIVFCELTHGQLTNWAAIMRGPMLHTTKRRATTMPTGALLTLAPVLLVVRRHMTRHASHFTIES
jgi:hypothetical protein